MADRYCGYCGQELRQGYQFCPSCGKPVNEGAETSPSKTRATPAQSLGRSAEPLLKGESQFIFGGGGQSVRVYEDRVEVRTRPFIARVVVDEVRYEQIAGVRLNSRVMVADLILETRGGARIVVKALPKGDANRITAAIRERM